jgi:transcriptional regulator of acetoin/glycerol metabolism
VIRAADLGLIARAAAAVQKPTAPEPDRAMIEAALAHSKGVISQAAAELGLSRQALYRRLEKLGIEA